MTEQNLRLCAETSTLLCESSKAPGSLSKLDSCLARKGIPFLPKQAANTGRFFSVQRSSQTSTSTAEFSKDLLMKLHQNHQVLLSSAMTPSRAAMWHGSLSATDSTAQDSQILEQRG